MAKHINQSTSMDRTGQIMAQHPHEELNQDFDNRSDSGLIINQSTSMDRTGQIMAQHPHEELNQDFDNRSDSGLINIGTEVLRDINLDGNKDFCTTKMIVGQAIDKDDRQDAPVCNQNSMVKSPYKASAGAIQDERSIVVSAADYSDVGSDDGNDSGSNIESDRNAESDIGNDVNSDVRSEVNSSEPLPAVKPTTVSDLDAAIPAASSTPRNRLKDKGKGALKARKNTKRQRINLPDPEFDGVVALITDDDEANESDQEPQPEKRSRRSPEEKRLSQMKNHPLRPPCACRMFCSERLTLERREVIHHQFWMNDYEKRKCYMRSLIKKVAGRHAAYSLPKADGSEMMVCRGMFLGTFGYHPVNSSIIESLWRNCGPSDRIPALSKRGKSSPPDSLKVDKKQVTEFLMSYKPVRPHYRIKHAPNRLYMPPSLNVQTLLNTYLLKGYPKISYTSFLRVVKELNLSFAALGKEECSTCAKLEQLGDHDAHIAHNQSAKMRRKEYARCKAWPEPDCIYYTLDMQKVLLLPRMDQFKECFFTQRLTCYHETLAPCGPIQQDRPVIAALWHDAIAGRGMDEVASAILKLLSSPCLMDARQCVVWLDNCGGQNKNYTLYTTLYCAIHSGELPYEQLTLNYFVSGHGFMSADSFHTRVESELKKMVNVINFRDLVRCVSYAGAHVATIEMGWRDFLSLPRTKVNMYPERVRLGQIASVQFNKGSNDVLFRTEIDQEWEVLDFIAPNFTKISIDSCEPFHNGPRGVLPAMKQGIMKQLVPLMGSLPNGNMRSSFWETLPTNKKSKAAAPIPKEEQ